MHKIAMEMGKWAIDKAKAHGFDNLTSQDWDDLKDCLETVKNAICADKEYREVDAMDDFEKEYGRMGYRGRAANGRFVHRSSRGRSAGYTPYLHMMDEDGEYDGMHDYYPEMLTGYRMGYTGGRRGVESMDGKGMEMRRPSRYGESYDRYADHRRHYHDSNDMESKQKMESAIGEVFDDMENVVQDVWKEMSPEQKQKYKARMTQMVQKMQ